MNVWFAMMVALAELLASTPDPAVASSLPTHSVIIHFTGEVTRGKRFIRALDQNYSFVLEPIALGWIIQVCLKSRPQCTLANLTPPLHEGPFQTFIEGWNFRNSDNSGPNAPGSKNVNAGVKKRFFIFSPKVGVLFDGPHSKWSCCQASDIDAIQKDGYGVLTFEKVELGDFTPGHRAYIKKMSFKAMIAYNPKASPE